MSRFSAAGDMRSAVEARSARARACPLETVSSQNRCWAGLRMGAAMGVMLAAAAVVAMAVALAMAAPSLAYAADEFPVRVGYFGGPYYDKASYSLDDLAQLEEDITGGTVVYEYSSMDKGGFLRKGFARGVPLRDILESAGIDAGAISSFYFDTADGYKVDDDGNPVKQWSYEALLGTRRYYYPSLWEYYDAEDLEIPKKHRETVEKSRVVVPTVIAIESSFARVGAGGEAVWSDSSTMSANAGIRLMFGQTSATDSTAGYSAHSIEGLKVTFAGHPTITVSRTDLEGEVGDVFEISYALQAADEVIADSGVSDIAWSVSDDSVARLTDLGDGKLKVEIVGEGSASLVASYGDAGFDGATSAAVGVSGQSSAPDADDVQDPDEQPPDEQPPDPEEEDDDPKAEGTGKGGDEQADERGSNPKPGKAGLEAGSPSADDDGASPGLAPVTMLPGASAVPIELASGPSGAMEVVEERASGSAAKAKVRELSQLAEQELLIQEMADYGLVAVTVGGACALLALLGLLGHFAWFARARRWPAGGRR